jgi:hypothetical protein
LKEISSRAEFAFYLAKAGKVRNKAPAVKSASDHIAQCILDIKKLTSYKGGMR